jgi:ABC-2 type transport system permease protein
MNLLAALAIVRKDVLLFFNDRRAVLMSFAAPIAIGSFFGFLFSSSGGDAAGRVKVQVVDGDGSAISRAVVGGLAADPHVELQPSTDENAAQEAVRHGRTTVAVLVPAGFGDAAGQAFFGAGTRPTLPLLYDPSHGPELGMVRGILTQHVMEAVSQEVFGGEQGRALTRRALDRLRTDTDTGMSAAERKALADMLESVDRWYTRDRDTSTPLAGAAASPSPARGGFALPYDVDERPVTARSGVAYNGFAHSFAGMGVQFLFFACIDLAVALLAERRLGLWKRLRAAPLSRATLLAGKTLSGATLALLTLLVTFTFAIVVWHVRIQGTIVGFLLVCGATALMASTFGLLVAALGRTPEATRGVAILAVLLMVMLGGAWVPSFVFPAWLQRITLAVPARWAVDGLDAATWRGIGLAGVLPTVGVLLAFAAAFGALAVARFRWDAE